ncbi:Glycosyltransferase AglD [uncultured archaeon]|nr:Glycosyltransferase AglD [uncultured archaeon]
MHPKKASIIIPAYNEEARIAETLKAYTSFAKKYGRRCKIELIAVCDGCTDKTPEIVRKFKSVKLIKFPARLGKGGGVFAGFNAATGDIIGFVDADNAIVPKEFEKLITEMLDGCDCAIASRKIPGSKIIEHGNQLKKFGSGAINLIARYIFGLDIHDAQCGAKIFKKEVVQKVLPLMRSTGFEFDIELLWRVKNAGYSIKEVPVTWYAKENSKFSMLESPKMLLSLLLRRIGL